MSIDIKSVADEVSKANSNEEAYKAFMDVLGEKFTEGVADGLAAAIDALNDAEMSATDPNAKSRLQTIIDLLGKGSTVNWQFSSPSLVTPMTQKVSLKTGSSSSPRILGGSVGVTGSYSF